MLILRTGCSGFYNKHWKGIFYPDNLAPKNWFDYYAQQFKTLELNNTFYQFPTEERLKKWYYKCPHDFVFSVKAPKAITHLHKFKNCEKQIEDFYSVCKNGLNEKLGCLLFQLPPSIQYSDEKLKEIINALHKGFKNVIEFRHLGWWNEKVYNALAEKEIIFCSVSHPELPEDIIANTSTAYIRLHGKTEMFYSGYEKETLKDLYRSITQNRQLKEAYIYFNNTAGNAGVLNAVEFQQINNKL